MMRRNGPMLATAAAGVVGGALLALSIWVDPGTGPVVEQPRIAEAVDLPPPTPLRVDEGQGTSDRSLESQGVSLEQGAWVQVADETGKLAQQYSASRIDPERDKWMRMEQPRAVLYQSGGRIVTLRAQRGRMRIPQQAIESGRLETAVVIRMFKPVNGKAVDLERDVPSLVVEADEALFDNRLGEIRCDRKVHVTTEQLTFAGEGLTVLLLEDGKTIERLTVDRPLSPITIVRKVQPELATEVVPSGAGPFWNGDESLTPATEQLSAGNGATLKPAAAKPAPLASNAQPPTTPFYRLVLERNVRIVRDGIKGRTRLEGDRLISVFSLEGASLGDSLAGAFDHATEGLCEQASDGGVPLPLPLQLFAHALAAQTEQVERTEIRYEGRLSMAITTDPADLLSSKDDVRVDIEGSPAKMDDEASGARVDCGVLRYVTGAEAVTIIAQPDRRFVLASPRLDLEATRLDLDRRTGKGLIQGEGRMRLGGADGAAVQALSTVPEAGMQAAAASVELMTVVAEPVPASQRTVRMQWTEQVALTFEPGGQAARLQQADFRGGVRADADEVRLDADTLVVDCVPQGSRDAVSHLLAKGAAKATQQPSGSSLAGERIELFLKPLPDGGSQPTRLIADGWVEASDKGQRLWTDAMECHFQPSQKGDGSPDRMELVDVQSRGKVQALVSNDARLWASSMDVDPARKHIVLKGPELLLVRGNAVADGMSELEMNEQSGEGSAPGAGRCRYFLQPIADSSPRPIARPTISIEPQMEATWKDGLLYRKLDSEASVLQLGGGVHAKASRTVRELDQITSNEALLTFTRGQGRLAQANREVGGDALGGDVNNLTRMVATGDVTLESRGWSCDDRSDEPRLLRLMGQELIHNTVTGESEVPSAGSLLIFDRDDEGTNAQPASLFDGRGTTRFRWSKRLEMKRNGPEGRFRIDFDGQVEMLHAGLRPQDTLTMTCDRLEATVNRMDGANPEQSGTAAPVDMGATVRLLRVQGLGRVFVRSPEADVECDTFDYDLRTKIATLSARPGRMVSVLQKGVKANPSPIRAESAQWDMESGRIRIVNGVGSGVR